MQFYIFFVYMFLFDVFLVSKRSPGNHSVRRKMHILNKWVNEMLLLCRTIDYGVAQGGIVR